MPKLCVNCCHYKSKSPHHPFASGRCDQNDVRRKMGGLFRGSSGFDTIDFAREVCDPQDKGLFIFFEPLDRLSEIPFAQITREVQPMPSNFA